MKYYKMLLLTVFCLVIAIIIPYNKESHIIYNHYYESNEDSLLSLKIDGTTISDFAPNKYDYSITTNDQSVTITATGSNCTVSGVGEKYLDIGTNNFAITCGSSSYNVKIVRTATTSTDATLKSLEIDGVTLSPSFNSSVTDYTAVTTNNKITVYAKANSSSASVSGGGNISLTSGKNTVKVTVTNQSNTKTYTITVDKIDAPALKTLALSEGDLNFKNNVYTYEVTVSKDIETLKISATLGDTSFSFVKDYGPRTISLSDGDNKALIKVKKPSGNIITYTITITKDKSSSDNYLSSLILSDGNIDFKKDKTNYTVKVLYNVQTIDITATTSDPDASIKVNNVKSLIVGKNTITIDVTATDKSKRTYTIVVTRLKKGESLTEDAVLKSLTIKNYQLKFKPTTYKYKLKIKKDVSKLNISYTLQNKKDQVKIIGNNNLKNGSQITIKVTNSDKLSNIYTINITKEKGFDIILAILITILVLGVGLLIFIIIKMRKPKNTKHSDNTPKHHHDKSIPIEDDEKTKEFDLDDNII